VGIRTREAASDFLRTRYVAEFNRRLAVRSEQPGSAFVACRRRDLDLIFALQFERTMNRGNTVSVQNLSLQIEAVGWRGTLAGCNVTVHQHLKGTFSRAPRAAPLGSLGHARHSFGGKQNAARTGCGWSFNSNRTFHLLRKPDILPC
jgi:hypothetical protein